MKANKLPLLLALLSAAACSDNSTVAPERASLVPPAARAAGGAFADAPTLTARELPRAVLQHRMLLNYGGPETYKMVIVRSGPGADKSTQAGAPVVDNFADAVLRVAPGGTIRVMAGTYTVDAVIIDRPLTIEPFNGARPLIRNQTADLSFIIDGAAPGTVTIHGLDFEQTTPLTVSIYSGGNHDQIVVDDCSFEIGAGGRGVDVDFGPVNSYALISNSRFHGGEVATFAHHSHVDVRNSKISGTTWGGIQYQIGARGVVDGNEVVNCGVVGCLRAVNDVDLDVRNNRFEDHRQDGNQYNHSLITASGRANVRINNNRIDGCGFGQCITVLNRAVANISDNQLYLPASDHVRLAIIGSDGFLGSRNNFAQFTPELTITDNKIIGVGSNPVGNPWAIMYAAIVMENGAIGHVHRNTIENAGAAFQADMFLNGATTGLLGGNFAAGSDNMVSNVANAVFAWGGNTRMNLHRNDFSDYLYGVSLYQSNSTDVTCNWWGSASGPHNNFAPAAVYTPWATQPVAGNNASCS